MVKISKKFNKFPKEIRKRNGLIVPFDVNRIVSAVYKAFEASGNPNHQKVEEITCIILEKLSKKHKRAKQFTPSVEEIQDIVEETLIEMDCAKVAKTYILYRQKRAEIRIEKQQILDKDDIDEIDKRFDSSALRVLKSRYLRKNDVGEVVESPKELFIRVAIHSALPDIIQDGRITRKKSNSNTEVIGEEEVFTINKAKELEGKLLIGKFVLNKFHIRALQRMFLRAEKQEKTKISWDRLVGMMKKNQLKEHEQTIESFYQLMVSRRFMPNTPALANFGSYLGMGSACFALDIEDSIDSIMTVLKKAAIVFKAGGGLGYNFSKLRSGGDYIKSTGGTSSGPIVFMRLFDTMTEVIKQGGIRRGANMGIMNSNHPDIEEFVTSKTGNRALKNFNISVMIMPDFWEYYKKNKPYPLISPRTGEVVNHISPRFLLDRISYQAWESGEPGVIFSDRINKYNPLLNALGPIEITNPCGEVLLYPNESCNLGSINVWAFLKKDKKGNKDIDWDGLEKTIKTAVRMLDNVIDVNVFPLSDIEEMSLKTRKVGLGIMGIANLLYDLEIPFNSSRGRNLMSKIAEFINYHSKYASVELAKEKGVFPYYKKSFYPEGKMPFSGFYDKKLWTMDWKKLVDDIKKYGIRNSFTTVVAPTGSISMIAGCSSGIEPVFSLAFEKSVSVGSFYYIDPVFERVMLSEGLFDEALINDIVSRSGSVEKVPYIPPKYKKVFVTAHDITPEDHVRTLACFQKWVDSSISKTNNFPADAIVDDVKKTYLLAYESGCKSVTVFRDKSIKDQVLNTTDGKKKKETKDELVRMTDVKVDGRAVYRDSSVFNINENGNGALSELENGKPVFCPNCKVPLSHKEGCISCSICGWGLCA